MKTKFKCCSSRFIRFCCIKKNVVKSKFFLNMVCRVINVLVDGLKNVDYVKTMWKLYLLEMALFNLKILKPTLHLTNKVQERNITKISLVLSGLHSTLYSASPLCPCVVKM